MMEKKAIRAYVSGRVQGVCFREYTRRKAVELGLEGWVKNLADGRVEVFAQGPLRKVEELVTWLQTGSPYAQVRRVDTCEEERMKLKGFLITF